MASPVFPYSSLSAVGTQTGSASIGHPRSPARSTRTLVFQRWWQTHQRSRPGGSTLRVRGGRGRTEKVAGLELPRLDRKVGEPPAPRDADGDAPRQRRWSSMVAGPPALRRHGGGRRQCGPLRARLGRGCAFARTARRRFASDGACGADRTSRPRTGARPEA